MNNSWSVNKKTSGTWDVTYNPEPAVHTSKKITIDSFGRMELPPIQLDKAVAIPPTFTRVQEQKRTYTFPNGSITLEGVTGISISKSGTHRINTSDGKKHIIPTGWLHIEFEASDWTF